MPFRDDVVERDAARAPHEDVCGDCGHDLDEHDADGCARCELLGGQCDLEGDDDHRLWTCPRKGAAQ